MHTENELNSVLILKHPNVVALNETSTNTTTQLVKDTMGKLVCNRHNRLSRTIVDN